MCLAELTTIRFFNFYFAEPHFPVNKYQNIWDLGMAIVNLFMRRSSSWRGGIEARPEFTYRDEVYRLLLGIIESSRMVSAASARTRAKRIDFLIPGKGWGFDVIKEGHRLAEVCGRFVGGGAYTGWMREGRLREWIILDCWTNKPPEYRKPSHLFPLSEKGIFAANWVLRW